MSSHSVDDISDNDNQSQQLSGEGHSITKTLTSCKTGSVQTLASQGNPPAPSRITWSNQRTDRIMDWLEKHPVRRQMLFSDSLSVARGENRPVVRNTKSVRVPIVRRIARHVFKNDSKEELRIAVDHHRKQFGESVQSRLDHLGKKYKECVRTLSGTGAGLSAEELASSGFSNPIEKVRGQFRWWDRLHAMWKSSPKYTSQPESSLPGQNLESSAMSLLFGAKADQDPMDNSNCQSNGDWSLMEYEDGSLVQTSQHSMHHPTPQQQFASQQQQYLALPQQQFASQQQQYSVLPQQQFAGQQQYTGQQQQQFTGQQQYAGQPQQQFNGQQQYVGQPQQQFNGQQQYVGQPQQQFTGQQQYAGVSTQSFGGNHVYRNPLPFPAHPSFSSASFDSFNSSTPSVHSVSSLNWPPTLAPTPSTPATIASQSDHSLVTGPSTTSVLTSPSATSLPGTRSVTAIRRQSLQASASAIRGSQDASLSQTPARGEDDSLSQTPSRASKKGKGKWARVDDAPNNPADDVSQTRPSEADQMADFMQPIIQSAKEQETAALEVKRLKLVHGSDVIRYKSLKVQSKIDETKKEEQIEITRLQVEQDLKMEEMRLNTHRMENDAKNNMEMKKFELLARLGVFGNQGGNQQVNMLRGLLGSSVHLPSPPEFSPSQIPSELHIGRAKISHIRLVITKLTPSADMNYDDADMPSQYTSTSSGHHHHPSAQNPSIFQRDYHSGDAIYENDV
ncbi:hypothetical protein SERLADRAFT_442417 [Serpula lacrymans var. lacrymans S7.9]|uniref:Uncharacterized protein n=1 Tax=Serpula lacrymans var. lacrymans (strain S7.9) TaxID=578457 RepID=F8P9F5_SERL9|nr:uncharacterized protein SERLADRAFT_442417 [Serpula lacrymans var. lacrymans S7.9]EGO20284.1 hypothetical protein SERLADRAFT_442417 [Serpula lacrymans var. lacrymans S7.9]